jgi:hypothetical protein
LKLLQWKASNGLSNKGFEELLKLIKNLLLEGNTLLETTYEARRAVCPWKHKRYMHVLMTAPSIMVRSMKFWMPVQYAKHVGIRSLKKIQAMLRGCIPRREFLPR